MSIIPQLKKRGLIVVDTCHYTFVKTHRMYNIKGEPYCKLWALGDNDVVT